MIRRRPTRLAVAAGAVLLALASTVPLASASGPTQATDELVLTDQTTLVPAGGTFAASVVASGLPGATSLRVTVHDRARSRTELAQAFRGRSGRTALRELAVPLAGLASDAEGNQRIDVPLTGDPGRPVTTPGVYPVEVAALDASGAVLDEVLTDLVVLPEAADAAPPLAVSVVAEIGTDPTEPPAADAARALAEAVTAEADVPATLAVGPAHLVDLAASDRAEDVALLAALRAAAAGNPVLSLPFVPISPDALVDAGLAEEAEHQLDRGAAVLEAGLGVVPRQRTWLTGPALGADGLELLSRLGVRQAVVPQTGVERVTDGVLSPARPFELAPPRQGNRRPPGPDDPITALLLDTALATAVHEDVAPALVAARTLGDLAQLWFEQPGTARAAVLTVDPTVADGAVRRILAGLRAPAIFRPVALDEAFADASPFVDGSGDPLRRSLDPADPRAITAAVADGVQEVRALRESVDEMVGDGSPVVAEVDRHLLRATADGLTTSVRDDELDQARAAVDRVADAVSSPETFTITLTAREGTVPLTIRNDTGGPVDVRLRFASSKVELPDGRERTLTLRDQVTRLDVAVRTRASGSFPFTVEVTSPDGRVALATTQYRVRSTAVSGVGLVLSIGAGLFLVVWWARHWRASRAKKLIDGPADPA